MFGGGLPFTTPLLVAQSSVASYFLWPFNAKLAEGAGWFKGLLIYFISMLCATGVMFFLAMTVDKALGVLPIPLDVAYSKVPLSQEALNALQYRYDGLLPPPIK